jgi:hypothetical protein
MPAIAAQVVTQRTGSPAQAEVDAARAGARDPTPLERRLDDYLARAVHVYRVDDGIQVLIRDPAMSPRTATAVLARLRGLLEGGGVWLRELRLNGDTLWAYDGASSQSLAGNDQVIDEIY